MYITPPNEHSKRTKLNRKNSEFPSDWASRNNKQLNGKLTTPGRGTAEEEGSEERIPYDISRFRKPQRRVLTRNGDERSGMFPSPLSIECRPLRILDVGQKYTSDSIQQETYNCYAHFNAISAIHRCFRLRSQRGIRRRA